MRAHLLEQRDVLSVKRDLNVFFFRSNKFVYVQNARLKLRHTDTRILIVFVAANL